MKSLQPPLYGLVLIGGESRRMGTDKSTLAYHGVPQWLHSARLLRSRCEAVFLSERTDSARGAEVGFPSLPDAFSVGGPINGILTALHARPEAAWLVLACDLPAFNEAELAHLVSHRDPDHIATALTDPDSGYPEPLAAIWEPAARRHIMSVLASGRNPAPSAILLDAKCKRLAPLRRESLINVNTEEESAVMMEDTRGAAPEGKTRSVEVSYFAVLREARGLGNEIVETKAATAEALYHALRKAHSFQHEITMLRVAVNDEFCSWDHPLHDGDKVVFIPPVAGG